MGSSWHRCNMAPYGGPRRLWWLPADDFFRPSPQTEASILSSQHHYPNSYNVICVFAGVYSTCWFRWKDFSQHQRLAFILRSDVAGVWHHAEERRSTTIAGWVSSECKFSEKNDNVLTVDRDAYETNNKSVFWINCTKSIEFTVRTACCTLTLQQFTWRWTWAWQVCPCLPLLLSSTFTITHRAEGCRLGYVLSSCMDLDDSSAYLLLTEPTLTMSMTRQFLM